LEALGFAEGGIAGLADGGVVKPLNGGVPAILAEAGVPEAAVPLTPEAVSTFIQPILSQVDLKLPDTAVANPLASKMAGLTPPIMPPFDFKFPEIEAPSMREALRIMADIRSALYGTLSVDTGKTMQTSRDDEMGDLGLAVGLSGVVG